MNMLKGDLVVCWRDDDVTFYSTDGSHAVDGRRLLYHAFSCVKMSDEPDAKSFLDDLESRGFALYTIRFSIDRKKKEQA